MKKWKMTPARRRSACRNIKKAQAARRAIKRGTHQKEVWTQPDSRFLEPLRRDVPLQVSDLKEPEVDFFKRQVVEYQKQTRQLTDELVHHRRLAKFLDWMMNR